MQRNDSMTKRAGWTALLVLAFLVGACGGSNGGADAERATATPTRTPRPASPTPTPPPGQNVRGLIVLGDDVAAGPGDALGAPPAEWVGPPYSPAFDRSLSHADLVLRGLPGMTVATGPDGQFVLPGLPPGRYTVDITKTVGGNLIVSAIPIVVGDDGTAVITVEISRGGARTVIEYDDGGVAVREVHGAYGNRLVTRDGRVSELADGWRTFTDADGDGRFEGNTGCLTGNLSVCQAGDRTCAEGATCQCAASCPFCEDCAGFVCAPPSIGGSPYACRGDGSCQRPGDRCVCVSSCPNCDDCVRQLCVPACGDVELAGIDVNGPSPLIVGRKAYISATARLSDGSVMDVTQLVEWTLSNPAVATLDSWGYLDATAVGTTDITAALGNHVSPPFRLEVIERPPLRRIFVNNVNCYYPLGYGYEDDVTGIPSLPPERGDILPVPYCHQVVRIGATLQFAAVGEFGDGLEYQDITGEVAWSVDPASVGTIEKGLFTAVGEGQGSVVASLDGISSEPTRVRVVSRPTIVSLSIYADNYAHAAVDGGPVRPGSDGAAPDVWCPECGFGMTILRGDTVKFRATAQYDTGEWEDVTPRVSWRSSDATVASIDAGGVLTALAQGATRVDATLGELISNPVDVRVVNEATLTYLYAYPEGTDRVVARGEQLYFKAWGNYDVGISRDVTAEAAWQSSNDAIGAFDTPGVFTGRAAGIVQVWAELAGLRSEPFTIEVYATGALAYCDPAHVNRGVWEDAFNRVTLESDCAEYQPQGIVQLRYTVTERQPHGGIFDPCLDLYVYDGDRRVRTLREEGCGEPFLAPGAPNADAAALKYQLLAFWDLKDERGQPVPPGVYTIYGRFYLYYDPIVQIDVVVLGGNGAPPDLVPSRASVVSPSLPGQCVEDPAQFSVSMDVCYANRGAGPARSSVLRVAGAGDAAPTDVRVSGLRPGQERCVNLPLLPFQADVTVDAAGEVAESDEGNNSATFFLPVPTPLPTCRPDGVAIQIGSGAAVRSRTVDIPVTLTTGGRAISGVQNDIVVDPRLIVERRPSGRPDCSVNSEIDKPASAFSLLPAVCAGAGPCSTRIRAIVFSLDNVDPIKDGSVLYTCRFTVPGGLSDRFGLGCAGPVASDPNGATVSSRCLDGEIRSDVR